MTAPLIFLLRGRCDDHGANPWFATLEGHQRAQLHLAIDAIGLAAPVAPRHRDRRRFHHVALDPMSDQKAMKPKAIQAGFLNDHDLDRRANAPFGLAAQTRQKIQQRVTVTAGDCMLRQLVAAW